MPLDLRSFTSSRFSKTLPSLLTAFLLAIAVWVMAINSSDPSVEKVYPNQVPIDSNPLRRLWAIGGSPAHVLEAVETQALARDALLIGHEIAYYASTRT